ncbi:MAG: type II secretion system protein [Candidatus Zipacnadales bacterium]
MANSPRKRGFTLIEMLVVIAIIVVLMAIIFPVYSVVRRRARETQCVSNLNQLMVALKQYREDHGKYPSTPWYDGTIGRYRGGFSDLYPDYIDDTSVLICPEDMTVKGLGQQTKQNLYCSYNGLPNNPRGGDWTLTEIYYNYNGYDFTGVPGGPITSQGIDNGDGPAVEAAYKAVIMSEYTPAGLQWRDAPRLKNRSAPGYTIATHCVHHRGKGSVDQQREFVARVGGNVDRNLKRAYLEEDPDGNGPKIAPWLGQTK